MLEPHKIATPPRWVEDSVPKPRNDTHRETSDFYSQVIAVLAPRWRVVTCRNDIQGFCRSEPQNLCMKGSGAVRATAPAETHFLKPVQAENCSQTHKQRQCSRRCQSGLDIIEKIRNPPLLEDTMGNFYTT